MYAAEMCSAKVGTKNSALISHTYHTFDEFEGCRALDFWSSIIGYSAMRAHHVRSRPLKNILSDVQAGRVVVYRCQGL
jgi:hypothetical protein